VRVASVAHLSGAIRGRRKDLGLSQDDLAQRAGVSRRWVVAFEGGGSTHVELGAVLRVLSALDLELDVSPRGSDSRTTTRPAVPADDPSTVDLDAHLDQLRHG
jgi:HTH-type transcriptional regulator/antitoxin HipB